MPDFLASKTNTKRNERVAQERAWLEKMCRKKLSDQEAFEAKQDLLGAFLWLIEQDRKQNPQLYESNRD